MNPYVQLVLDILTLLETPQFAQVVTDIQAIEGGSGTSLKTPGALAVVRQAVEHVGAQPAQTKPATVPGKPPAGKVSKGPGGYQIS